MNLISSMMKRMRMVMMGIRRVWDLVMVMQELCMVNVRKRKTVVISPMLVG
jgi:hypothetical protein